MGIVNGQICTESSLCENRHCPLHSHLLAWPLVVVVTGNEAECRSGFLNSFLTELLLSLNSLLLPSASAFLLLSPVCWATVCVPVVTELLIF